MNLRFQAIKASIINEAAAEGVATRCNGTVKVRRFARRNSLPHQSAYRFVWYINGNRASADDAVSFVQREGSN
jgi:hypothetical protein